MKIKQIISAVVVSTLLLATPFTAFAKSSSVIQAETISRETESTETQSVDALLIIWFVRVIGVIGGIIVFIIILGCVKRLLALY